MKLWLSREQSGLYMLTRWEPVRVRDNLYVKPGDMIGIRHLCEPGTRLLFGKTLERLESVRVQLQGQMLSEGAE